MKLFDTHCHIHEIVDDTHDGRGSHGGGDSMHDKWIAAGHADPDQVIADAAAAGVGGLICVGCTVKDSKLAIKFVESRASCWASIGVHPHEAKHGDVEKLADLADRPKVMAVGECGLDYFYEHSPKEDQIKALEFQIELALKHDLPLIFHVREAYDDFWPIFESYKSAGQRIRGVLHSFTDSAANMQKAVGYGLYIGVNGIATFTKSAEQLAMYKAIPLANLMLETDAPFLTPTPLRGRVNVPANVSLVAEFLAALRGESQTDLAEATTLNARRLFSIK